MITLLRTTGCRQSLRGEVTRLEMLSEELLAQLQEALALPMLPLVRLCLPFPHTCHGPPLYCTTLSLTAGAHLFAFLLPFFNSCHGLSFRCTILSLIAGARLFAFLLFFSNPLSWHALPLRHPVSEPSATAWNIGAVSCWTTAG